MKEIKCKNCPYFDEETIHGHGEYYGECNLIFNGLKIISCVLKEPEENIEIINHYKTDYIVWKDSNCKFFKLKETKWINIEEMETD